MCELNKDFWIQMFLFLFLWIDQKLEYFKVAQKQLLDPTSFCVLSCGTPILGQFTRKKIIGPEYLLSTRAPI